MRVTIKLILCVFLLSSTVFAKAQKSLEAEYKSAIAAYNQAIQNDNFAEINKNAELAYNLSKAFYGKNHKETREFEAIIFKRLLYIDDKPIQANKELKKAQKRYGKDSENIVDILLHAGSSKTVLDKSPRGHRHFKKAIKIITQTYGEGSEELLKLHVKIGKIYHYHTLSDKTINHYRDAVQIAALKVETVPLKTLSELFFLIADYQERNSLKYQGKNLNSFLQSKTLLDQIDTFLSSRSPIKCTSPLMCLQLAKAYGYQDKHDQATPFLMQLNDMPEVNRDTPVYSTLPEYKLEKKETGLEGHVAISFTINEQGFPIEYKIINSSGLPKYRKAVLDVAKEFRFLPRTQETEKKLKVYFILQRGSYR